MSKNRASGVPDDGGGRAISNGCRQDASTPRQSRFSLIELIVVITILAILGGLGAATYSSIKGGRGATAGAQRMADMIAQARMMAISENTRVALLLPKNDGFYDGSAYKDKIPITEMSSYETENQEPGVILRPCEIDANGQFLGWLDGGWVLMPEGSYFVFVDSDLTQIRDIELTLVNKSIVERDCRAIVFRTNGTLTSTTNPKVHVRPFSKSTSSYDPGAASSYEITVRWLTGLTDTSIKTLKGGAWQ